MIHIIEGVPGSGKTYYAVKYLLKHFYEYDDFYNEYVEKKNSNVLVITNIEDFKPKHLNLDVLIDRFTLEKFFTVENFEKIQKQYRVKNIVLIIDEAQRYFHRKFYNKEVFYFFQYHRHLGVDIFLITQNKNTLAREIVVLSEFIVKALPRSLQPNAFIYHFYDTEGNKLFTKSLRKDKKVFNVYSSMKVNEISKPKNVVLSKLIVYFSLLVACFFGFFLALDFFKDYYSSSSISTKSNSSFGSSSKSKSKSVSNSVNVSNAYNSKTVPFSNSNFVDAENFSEDFENIYYENSEFKMISVSRSSVNPHNYICIAGTNQCFNIIEK